MTGPTPTHATLRAPTFLLGPAAGLLREALAAASGAWSAPDVPLRVGQDPRAGLLSVLVDREGGRPPEAPGPLRAVVVAHPDDVLALVAAFGDARFVASDEEPVASERVLRTDLRTLLERPVDELRRICAWVELPYDQALRSPLEEAARTVDPVASGPSAYESEHTASVPAALHAIGGSLLVSTYQTGKLICLREQGGRLNTHFRDADKPMGIAVAPGRFALGTRTEIWDVRDLPGAAPQVEPVGTHDACYVPRHRHVTGDVAVHEMGWAGGELWFVATAFSCLATLDAEHSFVPRWTPPWITAVEAGDRCHLNGLCVVDGAVRYVTALGRTDEPGGWRAGKASGGVLFDVAAGEPVATGLSMPHSPRLYDGRLWVLQSGLGELGVVDPATGAVECVAQLPGFTRGMAIVDGFAFVGLSQIRESSTFGDLPIVHRLQERECGVWMVDLASGAVAGFVRFSDLVQEIFDIALLPGVRFPEIAEPGDALTARAFHLP